MAVNEYNKLPTTLSNQSDLSCSISAASVELANKHGLQTCYLMIFNLVLKHILDVLLQFFCLNVLYFNDKQSNVYIATIDASKAIDLINHFKLFSTAIKQNV